MATARTSSFIGYNDILSRSGTSLSANKESTGLPVSNLAHPHKTRVYRSTGTDCVISIDAGETVQAGVLFLAAANPSSAEDWTVRLTASVSTQSGTDVYDSGTITADQSNFWKSVLHIPPSTLSARYFQVSLSGACDPAAYMQIGRGFLGPVIVPPYPIVAPWSTEIVDLSVSKETVGGQILTYERPRIRESLVSFRGLTEAVAYSSLLAQIDKTVGVTGDVLIVPKPQSDDRHAEIVLGRIRSMGPVSYSDNGRYFSKDYRVRETA